MSARPSPSKSTVLIDHALVEIGMGVMIPVVAKSLGPRPFRKTGATVLAGHPLIVVVKTQSATPSPSKSALPRTCPLQMNPPAIMRPPAPALPPAVPPEPNQLEPAAPPPPVPAVAP